MLQRVYVRPAARLVSAVRQRVARQSAPYQDCPNRGLAIKRRAVGHLFPSALPGAAVATADVYKSESPAWGKRGFLMEKRRVGTARFMSRSTAADKGSTDSDAGLGPRPRP